MSNSAEATPLPADELKNLMLREPRLTVSTAESLTTGSVQMRLTALPGSSAFFAGGITAYSIDQKVRHLGVDRAAAEKVNCVSAEVARQMARGAIALFDTDLALATTGYAEPVPELDVREPFAFWALVHRRTEGPWREQTGRIAFPGMSRDDVKFNLAQALTAELLGYLRELRG